MFKRKSKEPVLKEMLVLKDLKPTDIVFFRFSKPYSNKEAKSIREILLEILKCKVVFLPENVEAVTVNQEVVKWHLK